MKKIALINDLSGFGKCSLTAAIPVISVMGLQACPLPTAVLSAQTGFDEYYCDDYTDRMNIFTDQWKKMGVEFDGIYSGFLASAKQIEKVKYFLDNFLNDNNFYLADPVMGDHGEPYDLFSEELLVGMKELAVKADVITPNLTEVCMLADADYSEIVKHNHEDNYVEIIRELCKKLINKAEKPQTVIVTGIIRKCGDKEYVGNLAMSDNEWFYVINSKIQKDLIILGLLSAVFAQLGDLFASVICGSFMNGLTLKEALEKATSFLTEAIEEAANEGIPSPHGVYFERHLGKLM